MEVKLASDGFLVLRTLFRPASGDGSSPEGEVLLVPGRLYGTDKT